LSPFDNGWLFNDKYEQEVTKMKSLKLDRVVGKRLDNQNDYLQVKPELPTNRNPFRSTQPSIKKNKNIKQGKWRH